MTTLTNIQQSIICIAAFTANGDIEKLTPSLHQGLDSGLTINQIKAILEQMYAYAGFPRSLNGLATFMNVIAQRKEKGIDDQKGEEPTTFPKDKTSLEVGSANQTALVGQVVSGALFDFSPEADHFLKAHLFGDIFQNDVLTWKQRELATIAGLANMQGVNPQLQAHYNISLHNGITGQQLNEFINLLEKVCGKEVADNANVVLQSVRNK